MLPPDNIKDIQKNFSTLAEYKQYEELPDTNPLVIIDGDCSIVYLNNSFRNAFSLNEGESFSDVNSDPDLVHMVQGFIKSHYSGFHFDLKLGYNIASHSDNYSVDVERIYIAGKEYFVLLFESVEERLKLEVRINTIHNAIEFGNIPVIITDSVGNVIYITRSVERLLNKTIEEVYHQFFTNALSNLFTRDDLKTAEAAFHENGSWIKIQSHFDEKGSLAYKEFNLSPIYKGGERPANYIITANDITHYLLKNQIIKESEKKLRLIINNISDLLLIIREENGLYYFENANNNFCDIFSVEKTEVVNVEIQQILNENLTEIILNSVENLKTRDKIFPEDELSINGKCYNVKTTFLQYNISKEQYYIVSLQDVTAQKESQFQFKNAYEKELQLNNLKTIFIENMSHEIRTPFNAIVGYSEIIDDCIENGDYDTIQEFIVSVKEVLGRVTHLFGNIVEVSQIESNEITIEKVHLNVNQVLRSIYYKKHQEAEQKGLDFNLDICDKDVLAEVDWIKLEKIVLSLVDNAIKYTNFGKIELSSYADEENIKIIIADTGEAMNPEQIKNLLEPFSQEEVGYTRQYQGAGLGLTIAYKLTALMGGKFEILSEKGTGTQVTIIFPVVKEQII